MKLNLLFILNWRTQCHFDRNEKKNMEVCKRHVDFISRKRCAFVVIVVFNSQNFSGKQYESVHNEYLNSQPDRLSRKKYTL